MIGFTAYPSGEEIARALDGESEASAEMLVHYAELFMRLNIFEINELKEEIRSLTTEHEDNISSVVAFADFLKECAK